MSSVKSTNVTAVPRIGYVENAMSIVRDCKSGDPSRHLYCVLSHVMGSMSAILLPIIIMVGLVGNAIVVNVTLRRQRPLTRQNVYLGCIAIADSFNLVIVGVFNNFLIKGLPWLTQGRVGFFLQNVSEEWCKVNRYAMHFAQLLSCAWLLLLVVDRVLAIHRPLAMKKVAWTFAVKAAVATFVLSAVACLPVGILMSQLSLNMPDGSQLIYCYRIDIPELRWFLFVIIAALANPPTLPIFVMLLLNFFLISRVVAAVKLRRRLQSAGRARGADLGDISGAVIVVMLSVIYLVLYLPVLIIRSIFNVDMMQLDLVANIDYLSLLSICHTRPRFWPRPTSLSAASS